MLSPLDWLRLYASSKSSNTLTEAGETAARSSPCRVLFLPQFTIVDHLGIDGSIFTRQPDEAASRAAMPDHVGYSLAHYPGQHSVCGRWKLPDRLLNQAFDPRRLQQLPRTVQFTEQPWLPVASHGLAHFSQSLTCREFYLADFLRCTSWFLLNQAPCQFALERYQ